VQTLNNHACEVAVEQGRILVTLGAKDDKPLVANDFADRPLTEQPAKVQASFYVALSPSGELVRVASMSIPDRSAVAALVAGWIAEGLSVQQAGLKELSKLVKLAEKREKEDAAQTKTLVEPSAVPAASPSSEDPAKTAVAQTGPASHAEGNELPPGNPFSQSPDDDGEPTDSTAETSAELEAA